MAESILFVGKRPEAIQAARRLGFTVLLLSEKGPRRADPVDDFRLAVFDGSDPTPAARELAHGHAVRAVLAGTERGVEAAAWVREALGLPGLSRTVAACFSDKAAMRAAAHRAGIPCATFVSGASRPNRETLLAAIGLPMVIKDRRGSGGRNMIIARTPDEVPESLPAHRLAESFVSGVELSVESTVVRGEPVFTNCTEYVIPRWCNVLPHSMPLAQEAEVLAFNRRVLQGLGLERGFAHLELFLTADGIRFGEVAARPPGGRIMELIGLAYGRDPWGDWIRDECGDPVDPPTPATRFAGMRVFHPGPGVVKSLRGVRAAREVPGVVRVSNFLRKGKAVGPRLGVSQEGGHIVATDSDPEALKSTLEKAYSCIRITLEEAPDPPAA